MSQELTRKLENEAVYIIGIDPDTKKCGVCLMDESGAILELLNVEPAALALALLNADRFKPLIVAFEDVERVKTIYRKNRRGNARVQAHIAQSVGKVKGVANMLLSIIKDKHQVHLVAPGIGKTVKKNAKLFNKIFKWEGRSNEDTRDAAALAHYVLTHELKL